MSASRSKRAAGREFIGEAGSGKSALFALMSLRARPERGTLIVAGRNSQRLSQRKLERARAKIGSCQQRELLLEGRSVTENLLLPCMARGALRRAAREVEETLERLDLTALGDVPITHLSASERRVVAIARACVGSPSLVLIDGALEGLDLAWKVRARAHLRRVHRQGATVVLFGREPVGPMTGHGMEFRLSEGKLEALEHAVHAPSPEVAGRRRP